MCVRLYWRFDAVSSARPVIPGTKVETCSLQGVLNCHGEDGKWLMNWLCSSSTGKVQKDHWLAMETAAIRKTLRNVNSQSRIQIKKNIIIII